MLKDKTDLSYRIAPRVGRELLPSEIQMRTELNIKPQEEEKVQYDPTKPLHFKFKILEEYYQDYQKKKSSQSNPTQKENNQA